MKNIRWTFDDQEEKKVAEKISQKIIMTEGLKYEFGEHGCEAKIRQKYCDNTWMQLNKFGKEFQCRIEEIK